METVSWEIVGNLADHPKSQAVLDLLAEVREDYPDAGGNSMVVVLENQERQPIIRAQTLGLGTFMGLISGLQDLDLQDRLEGAIAA